VRGIGAAAVPSLSGLSPEAAADRRHEGAELPPQQWSCDQSSPPVSSYCPDDPYILHPA
jgi:hypothetical protein